MAITHEDVAKLVSTTDKIVNAEVERALHPNRLRRGGDTHLKSLETLLEHVSPHHIGHSLLKRLNRKGLSPGRTHSFYHRLCLAASRDDKKQLLPHWKLNSSGAGYRFVDALGVRRPQNSPAPTRFENLEFSAPCVVKPWYGTNSRGCYLVYGNDRIVHVKDNSEFRDWSEVEQHAASLMSPERKGTRLRDSWTVEELILEDEVRRVPARDYKFYAFYGEVHLVQEIQRSPERRMSYSTRTSSGIAPRTDESSELYDGGVLDGSYFDLVERVSAAIPAPYMRIDMLASLDGLVFGEFTPFPGNSSDFLPEWDRRLGKAYHDAEVRMMRDLVGGKTFPEFRAAVSSSGARGEAPHAD